jgi:mortality factor 4-like protein 1
MGQSIFFDYLVFLLLNVVQLPSLIAHTNMDQDSIAILRDHFTSILLYMQKNQEDLFQSEYENAAAEYIALQK